MTILDRFHIQGFFQHHGKARRLPAISHAAF